MAQTNLILYTSATNDSILAAMANILFCQEGGHTYTLKDLAGITTGDIDVYLATLVAATYDSIFVNVPCNSTVATASLSCAQQYTLRALLKVASQGTLSTLNENATTSTAATIGLAGLTWTVNSLANAHVFIYSGTGAGQIATIKSNTATVATIWGTFSTTPDNTSDFYIVTGLHLYMNGTAQVTTAGSSVKSIVELAWDSVYPNNTIPLLLSYRAGSPAYASYYGTSSAIDASTLTDSAASWSTNQWAGFYVAISTASTNGYQYMLVASNTGTVLTGTLMTATTYWSRGLTPTGASAYKIFNQLSDVFADLKTKYYVMTYLTSLTSSAVLAEYKRILDTNYSLKTLPANFAPVQDIAYIQGTVLPTGDTIMDALVAGVTL